MASSGSAASGACHGPPFTDTVVTRRRPSAGDPGRRARWRTKAWWQRSKSCSGTVPFMARATASCGPGCALPASAPAGAASCGSCARTARLLAHQRAGRPHGSRAHDGTITTERVDVMWGTDLTSVTTGEGQAAVFITVDHCSTECVGIHASRGADRFQALEPVRQAVRQRHGGFAKGIASGLRLRHDHGSQYVSHDFQAESRFLGIESSPAFVREPEGNGCAERFIRVLKENLLWVRRFDTVEELRLALLAFQQTYNQSWIIERHGYRTPAQVRAEQATALPMAA